MTAARWTHDLSVKMRSVPDPASSFQRKWNLYVSVSKRPFMNGFDDGGPADHY